MKRLAVVVLAALAGCTGGGDDDPGPVRPPAVDVFQLVAVHNYEDPVITEPLDGGAVQPVALPAEAGEGTWYTSFSPDGERILFTGVLARRQGDRFTYSATDLFTIRPDGSDLSRLTEGEDAQGGRFSPDGRTVAFTRDPHPGERPFTATLWLMDADGSDPAAGVR